MYTQAKKKQVIKLRASGLSFEKITKELGISRSIVSSICKRQAKEMNINARNIAFY